MLKSTPREYERRDRLALRRSCLFLKGNKDMKTRLKPDLSGWEWGYWPKRLKEALRPRIEVRKTKKNSLGTITFSLDDLDLGFDEDELERQLAKIAQEIIETFFETALDICLTEKGVAFGQTDSYKGAIPPQVIPWCEVFLMAPPQEIVSAMQAAHHMIAQE